MRVRAGPGGGGAWASSDATLPCCRGSGPMNQGSASARQVLLNTVGYFVCAPLLTALQGLGKCKSVLMHALHHPIELPQWKQST